MRIRYWNAPVTIALAAFFMFGTASAQATTLGFHPITNTSGVAGDVAEQLTVQISEPNAGQAEFMFYNAVGIVSSLTDIYFDDAASLFHSMIGIDQSSGVTFSPDASPPVLSGSEPYGFTASFSADADPAVTGSGVDQAGEWVSIAFQLMNGVGTDDVLLALQPGNGLRIGLRLQTINGGTGDSFMSPSPVPLPTGLLLFLSGLAGIGVLGRSKAKRQRLSAA